LAEKSFSLFGGQLDAHVAKPSLKPNQLWLVKNDDEHVDNFEKLMAIAEGQGDICRLARRLIGKPS
jgi:hypothetical protein